jgi:hypothetical protein
VDREVDVDADIWRAAANKFGYLVYEVVTAKPPVFLDNEMSLRVLRAFQAELRKNAAEVAPFSEASTKSGPSITLHASPREVTDVSARWIVFSEYIGLFAWGSRASLGIVNENGPNGRTPIMATIGRR